MRSRSRKSQNKDQEEMQERNGEGTEESVTKNCRASVRRGRNAASTSQPVEETVGPRTRAKKSSDGAELQLKEEEDVRPSRTRGKAAATSLLANQDEGNRSSVLDGEVGVCPTATARGRGKRGVRSVAKTDSKATSKELLEEDQDKAIPKEVLKKQSIKKEAADTADGGVVNGDLNQELSAPKRSRKRGTDSGETVVATASTASVRRRNRGALKSEPESTNGGEMDNQSSPRKSRRGNRDVHVKEEEAKEEEEKLEGSGKGRSRTKKQTQQRHGSSKLVDAESGESMDCSSSDAVTEKLTKKEPLARTTLTGTNGKCVGAHCSIKGGLWNAVRDASSIGARSFALFLRSQRQWHAKPLAEGDAERFRRACAEHGFPPHLVLPHGSYLLNLGSPNQETLAASRQALEDELGRCQRLGLTLYNFHPGSTCGKIPVEECLDKIAESINMALAKTSGVTAVLENMSCQGNTVGGRFEELRGIIDRVTDKTRVGVCLDTCHAFAAGYDLSTETGFKKMVSDFDRIVGFEFLKGMHINDSKGEVGCHLDRHENIGRGKIGLDGFRRVMNDPRFNDIPLILETPPDYGYSKEIETLNSLMN